ncbi:D-protein [Thecamonas trahens ATCC 50062]|uniref:D-protein n=1 Tax=Thecamonas trahens ATCC 50062 TaxID=461836 RepID=A0A0L0DN06_THETB|nr:D-protein [Thecamonas trahens ATCC 50062]KNC52798.1 D-protein [Thecamonas trahens ATCC 50062]|eukprot:XP_013755107.1 D-protein [Thecamonas trahens ATCC 50062]
MGGSPPATGRLGGCSATLNGVMYMVGGSLTGSVAPPFASDVLSLEISTGVWTNHTLATAASPVPRQACALAAVNIGSDVVLYLLGGRGESAATLDDFWAFSVSASSWYQFAASAWSAIPSRGAPVADHAMVAIDDGGTTKLVVIFDAELSSLDVYTIGSAYNAEDGSWALVPTTGTEPNRPDCRDNAGVVSWGSSLAVFGGHYQKFTTGDVATTNVLDVATWTWSALTTAGTPPSAKRSMMVAPLGGLSALGKRIMLVFAGNSGNTLVDELHSLHIDDASGTPTWYSVTPAGGSLPPPQELSLLGIDAAGAKAVIYGGSPSSSVVFSYDVGPRIATVAPEATLATGGHVAYPCPIASAIGTPVTSATCTVTGPIPSTIFTADAYVVALSASAGLPPVSGLVTFEAVPQPAIFAVVDPSDLDAVVTAGTTPTVNVTARAGLDFLALNAADLVSITVGGVACTSVTFHSATSITCAVPVLTAAKHAVIVTSASGGASAANGAHLVALPPPAVTSLSKTSGPQAGGDSLTLTGTWLGGSGVSIASLPGAAPADIVDNPTVSVTIASVACTVTAQSSTEVTCTTGAFATTGVFAVTVTTRNGGTAASTISYRVVAPPAVTSVTPSSGPPGTQLLVEGTSLGTSLADILVVRVGSAECRVTSVLGSPVSALNCTLGEGSAGAYDVVVTTTSGGSGSSAVQFTYVPDETGSVVPPPPPPTTDTILPLWMFAVLAALCCLCIIIGLCLARRKAREESEYEYIEYSEEVIKPATSILSVDGSSIHIPTGILPVAAPQKVMLKKRVRRPKLPADMHSSSDLRETDISSDEYIYEGDDDDSSSLDDDSYDHTAASTRQPSRPRRRRRSVQSGTTASASCSGLFDVPHLARAAVECARNVAAADADAAALDGHLSTSKVVSLGFVPRAVVYNAFVQPYIANLATFIDGEYVTLLYNLCSHLKPQARQASRSVGR